jgi:hypothetical protein
MIALSGAFVLLACAKKGIVEYSPPKGLPSVIITDEHPDSIQLRPFDLQNVSIDGDTISIGLQYGGGCRDHEFSLYMSPAAFAESTPVRASLYLWHEDNEDPCDALLSQEVLFDLRPIAELFRQQYGGYDEILIAVSNYSVGISDPDWIVKSYFPK